MQGVALILPFTHQSSLPFDCDLGLFSWTFQREEFRQWILSDCKWQLRLVGGPGSGKTVFSVLTEYHLHNIFQSPHVRVLRIFFTGVSELDGNTLSWHVLAELLRQLRAPESSGSRSIQQTSSCKGEATALTNIEALRAAVASELSPLERAFLLLDDVDLCDSRQWRAIETELAILQQQRMNIMTTSRLSLWHEYSTAYCDTEMEPDHSHLPTQLFWYCRCQDSVEEAILVCQSCKDAGYVCVICGEAGNLVEPYNHVDLSIECRDEIMSDYVALNLEQTHGDLGLSDPTMPKPPHSKLGNALIKSQGSAAQLRDKIVQDAEGNIAMAKLRLGVTDVTKTVEEAVRYGDRLPTTIVALFDAGVASIQRQPADTADLGLKAIVGVANEFHERPFSELERWLRRQVKEEQCTQAAPRTKIRRFTIEEVLRAAAGYLVVDSSSDRPIRLYHDSFGYYVTERYNETLFWIHTSTNAIGTEEFERPQRMQTWHASRRNLSRADTWK